MAIRGVVSTLSDPKYTEALERELESIKEQLAIALEQIRELRGGGA